MPDGACWYTNDLVHAVSGEDRAADAIDEIVAAVQVEHAAVRAILERAKADLTALLGAEHCTGHDPYGGRTDALDVLETAIKDAAPPDHHIRDAARDYLSDCE